MRGLLISSNSSTQIRDYQRVRHPRPGRKLRQKERGDKEAMAGLFHHSDFPLRTHPHDPERAIVDPVSIRRVEAIATAESFRCALSPVRLVGQRPRQDLHRLGLASQGAGQSGDQQTRRVRGRLFVRRYLFMCRIVDPQHVPSIL
jgi:hypothetical protein